MSGRPDPEYNLHHVMLSKPIHNKQLTKDCQQITKNCMHIIDGLVNCKHTMKLYKEKMWMEN